MFQRKDTYTNPEPVREERYGNIPCRGYRDKVKADPECYISEHCQIIGDVELGYRSVILEGAVLRADSDRIVIGAESNVQENCVLHESAGFPLVLGEHSSIGHGAIVHGAIIGDNSLIGMGAVVMDGAHIGNNCVVGAGAVVTEGMVVPDFYMAVGVPAKLRGPMTQEKADSIVQPFAEANLAEAENMLASGLLHHPSPELMRKIGATR